MKYKFVIVDDNIEDIRKIKELLVKHPDNIFFECIYLSSNDINKVLNCNYDLYILDIDMPEINGISLAQRIEIINTDAQFVFYSNREDLVFDSLIVNSIYFIRKSHLKADLDIALKKSLKKLHFLAKSFTMGQVEVLFNKILYIESQGNYLILHTSDSKKISLRTSLKDVRNDFASNNFIMIYHGIMVNMNQIKKLDHLNLEVTLLTNLKLPISHRKFKHVETLYLNFLLGEKL
ncbi:LytR/AlgR family response regulator transcription factor [Anaerorhabdus furcosa]|uniref:Two component transcriptional regulator, LytTR family n=1 Tax=Anaerorhabdus furcosa TaxID=118967 RepID=A0A1T4JVU5_9FIRM|nr:LytTR family DNA-binding domain-containing protein [Anaerorhabdus furcosa]SJZ34330.1 two component transcriptional regulator, LytTR family [Anaerorhabdus furcosa]